MLKRIATLLTACLAAALAAAPSGAETVLKISSWAPPTHPINAVVWPTWGKWVSEATEGRVTTKIEYKLASPLNQFALVRDGIADAAWIFHGLQHTLRGLAGRRDAEPRHQRRGRQRRLLGRCMRNTSTRPTNTAAPC